MKKNLARLLTFAAVSICLGGCSDDGGGNLSDSQLVEAFRNPSNEWRGKPFWAWNGKLEKDELLRQVDAMHDMGFGGYFMHSRVGLQTEYLGKEWFELTNAVADYGQQKGMMNYLYDEDRWPSGTAGGYVTQNPEYRMNFVTLRIVPRGQYEWADTLLAAFICQLDGTSFSDLHRLQPGQRIDTLKGNSVLTFFREKAVDTDFVNGYSYVDAMNGEATQKFIELTHEAYLKNCGDRIGRNIVGVFTDEPHRGPLFTKFSNDNPNRPMMCPWTDKFAGEYKARFGEDIIEQLPYLFLHPNGETYHRVKWQYCEMAQELFLKNFMKPIYEWCDSHNMAFTGHLLHEDNFVSQVAMQGSLMRSYELMHIPGIDELTQVNRNYWIVKQLASVGHQTGKRRLLSELYGATGWQMTFEDYKQVGDWQALYGINLRCPHLAWYTMEGEAKRDYPASIFYQSGWYKDFKYVEDYYARIGMMLAQGKPKCDLLVISPIESVFAQVAVDAFNELKPASPVIAKIEQNYFDLFYWLQSEKIDFDYGDEEMMSRLASVGKDADGQTILRVGQAEYKTVFVGNMATMRSTTLQLLKDFYAQGGQIVMGGEAPDMLDVEKSDEPKTLLQHATQADYNKDSITRALLSKISPTVTVRDSLGNNIDSIFCQARIDGERTVYVIMNMSRKDDYGEVTVHLPSQGFLTEWNCRNGEVYAIADVEKADSGITFKASFAPLEEHVFTTSPQAITPLLPLEGELEGVSTHHLAPRSSNHPAPRSSLLAPRTYEYELSEPNVMPLDMAYYTVDGKRSAQTMEILHIDRAIRSHYGLKYRGGEMLQPWFATQHPSPPLPAPRSSLLELEFPFTVETLPNEVFLCIETPERFSIMLNGNPVDAKADGWWIDPCFKRIRLNGLIVGKNIITLKADFTQDLNIETLYLIGDFGVNGSGEADSFSKPVITKLPERLSIGDIVKQGLPFYSGVVSYRIDSLPKVPGQRHREIDIPNFEAACIRLRPSHVGEDLQSPPLIAFIPYSTDISDVEGGLWLDVVLTRRNTFGPLHFRPARNWAYYPDLFVATPEEGYTDAYVLLPMGLLERPVVKTY